MRSDFGFPNIQPAQKSIIYDRYSEKRFSMILGTVIISGLLYMVIYFNMKTESAVNQYEQSLNQQIAVEQLKWRMK